MNAPLSPPAVVPPYKHTPLVSARIIFTVLNLLFFCSLDAAASADDRLQEYVDNQYEFAFQFPADWKIQTTPSLENEDQPRVLVKHPTRPVYVAAFVGKLATSIEKEKYEGSARRELITESIVQLTVDQIYKRTSREIGAEKMIVVETKTIASQVGIKFYISTLHVKGNLPIIVSGIHIVPFEKPYIVTFIMVTPADKSAIRDNETITNVFNSFHLARELPDK